MMRFLTGCVCLIIGHTAWGAQKPYFQQETNYKIHVRLDDFRNELFADEEIEYVNNSPEALPFIYFHLWPNAYKNNQTELAKQLLENGSTNFNFSPEADKGYIDQLDFKVNGETVKWEFAGDTIDICRIWLKQPLQHGERITISTPFHVKIPLGKFSRLGHLGQQYQITQWYPKPAVYDRNGWNQMPFLNQGEFYSEFGSFDVFITIPKNYVLGATGDRIDAPEEEEFLQKKADETLEWAKEFERTGIKKEEFPTSDSITKTVHYHQDRVHDFAWFCDKRYHVLKGSMKTPHIQMPVTTWLMFTESEAEFWLKATPYIQDAITFYSLWNGDYPYHQVTAVDGGLSAGSGMEYPNITVIGNVSSAFTLETVIMHEVGHNWFYGILGSNERKNPWMDEGLNSFDENRYIKTKYPDAKLLGNGSDFIGKTFDLNRYNHKHLSYLEYLLNARKEEDQPIQLPAPDYTNFNYAAIVYAKTALSFDYLMAFLGTSTMDAAMQQYFETWKFKHPQPDDLRKILEGVSHKDLSWFFDDLINTTKKLDYQILASRPHANGFSVAVKNSGQIKGPVALCGIKNNVIRGIVWYDGFWGTEVLSFPPVPEGIDYFMIDYNSDMPEINRNNNIVRTKGILKRLEPLKLQFLGSLDRPDRTQIFWSPVIGWNDYNHFMFGTAIYNNILPQKRFEYLFMPLYSGATKSLCGTGNITFNVPLQKTVFQQITIKLSGTRYAYNDIPFAMNFNRIVPEINFELRKKKPRSHITQKIGLRSVLILKDDYATQYVYGSEPSYTRKTDTVLINNITYSLVNSRVLHPYNLLIDYQQGANMQKLSATLHAEITLSKQKSIEIRYFGGVFLQTDGNPAYAFRMSGETGAQDYLYDSVGLLSRQFTETDGGFKTATPQIESTSWLSSLNVKSPLPYLPKAIRLYADLGTCNQSFSHTGTPVFYDAGINVGLPKNIFEINFPILMSPQIHDYLYSISKLRYFETVRFTLNLKLIDPFELIRNFSL
jgi:hypothetical protein